MMRRFMCDKTRYPRDRSPGHGCVEEWRDDRKQQIAAGQNAKMCGARKHGELRIREVAHCGVRLAAAEQSKRLHPVRGQNGSGISDHNQGSRWKRGHASIPVAV